MPEVTDRDVAHFLAEHYSLLRWVFRITRLAAQKTVKYYRDEQKAYGNLLVRIREKGLCHDYDGTLTFLRQDLMVLETSPGLIKTDSWDEIDKVHVSGGCPFMR